QRAEGLGLASNRRCPRSGRARRSGARPGRRRVSRAARILSSDIMTTAPRRLIAPPMDAIPSKDLVNGRRLIAGRSVRWSEPRAQGGDAAGWGAGETMADAARRAAAETPDRVLVEEGDTRLDCRGLWEQANALAQVLLVRAPVGSVVSFMLPNWYEAAVIYL